MSRYLESTQHGYELSMTLELEENLLRTKSTAGHVTKEISPKLMSCNDEPIQRLTIKFSPRGFDKHLGCYRTS